MKKKSQPNPDDLTAKLVLSPTRVRELQPEVAKMLSEYPTLELSLALLKQQQQEQGAARETSRGKWERGWSAERSKAWRAFE